MTIWAVSDFASPDVGDLPAKLDVAVVGAGLSGLSCAYHVLLQNPHARVAVFEAAELAQGASGHTTGMVTPGIGQDFAALVKRLGLSKAAELYEQTRSAVQYVADLIVRERIVCKYERVGQLLVAHGAAGSARLLGQANALAAANQPCERLDAEALAARIQLNFAPTRGLAALYLSDAAMLNPVQLVHGLARAVQARGGRIFCQHQVQQRQGTTLQLAAGQVQAQQVILATAAQSHALTGLIGRIIPIRLKVLATAPLTAPQMTLLGWAGRECVIDSRQLFNYFRVTHDQRLILGGGAPSYGVAPKLDYADIQHALQGLVPGVEVQKQWSGTIDYTLDGLPVIEQVAKNVFYVGGFCGHGIALGVRSGLWVAQMLAGENHPFIRKRAAPRVPGEWLRRGAFAIASSWMKWRDVNDG